MAVGVRYQLPPGEAHPYRHRRPRRFWRSKGHVLRFNSGWSARQATTRAGRSVILWELSP